MTKFRNSRSRAILKFYGEAHVSSYTIDILKKHLLAKAPAKQGKNSGLVCPYCLEKHCRHCNCKKCLKQWKKVKNDWKYEDDRIRFGNQYSDRQLSYEEARKHDFNVIATPQPKKVKKIELPDIDSVFEDRMESMQRCHEIPCNYQYMGYDIIWYPHLVGNGSKYRLTVTNLEIGEVRAGFFEDWVTNSLKNK